MLQKPWVIVPLTAHIGPDDFDERGFVDRVSQQAYSPCCSLSARPRNLNLIFPMRRLSYT